MPTTYETEGGTSVASPDTIEFSVDPITGVTINPNYSQDYSNAVNTANNLSVYDEAFNLSLGYAQQASDANLANNMNWAAAMQPFIQGLTASDNAFNQQQRLSAVEYALPGARQTTLNAIDRGNTYAQGRLISSIDDRAFESVSRSMAADSTFLRGFGDDSTVGRKASDLMSAQDRLGISMMGESSLQNWLQVGNQMFVDQPIKSDVGSQVSVTPTMDVGTAALAGSEWLGSMNMISATDAMNASIGVASTQAQYDLQTQMFNSGIQLEEYYAAVADEQSQTNALQYAYNQEASTANLQMQIDAQTASSETAADAQTSAATTQAVSSLAMMALMFA